MKTFIIFSLLLLISTSKTFAQNAKIENLEKRIKETKNEASKAIKDASICHKTLKSDGRGNLWNTTETYLTDAIKYYNNALSREKDIFSFPDDTFKVATRLANDVLYFGRSEGPRYGISKATKSCSKS